MKKLLFIFIVLLFFPLLKIDAYYCKYSEISKLKKIASNVTTKIDYIESNNTVTFSVTLTNLNKDIYFVDKTTGKEYRFTKEEITITGYSSGLKVQYDFYPVNENCNDQVIYNLWISLPTYNKYYNDAVCKGIETYTLCQKWSSHNLSYDKFKEKVEEYKNSLIINPPKEDNPIYEEYSIFSIIIEYLIRYYYVILIIIIIICAIGIYFQNKKDSIYD